MPSKQLLDLRSEIGNASKRAKKYPNDPDTLEQLRRARRDYAAAAIEDHIKKIVDGFPPLTDEQKSRLSLLLQGVAA